MNGWKNPLRSKWRVWRIRKAIDNDLKRANLTKCRLINLKPLFTAHITQAFSFLTVTMPTEVQNV